jgi:S-DNA-T family DNA segregation ATPase FtsK/SpoIIIE
MEVTTNPTAKNLVGRFGAETSYWVLRFVGISAWLFPCFLLWMTYIALRNARRLALTRGVAMIICIVALSGLAAMVESFPRSQYFSAGLGGLLGGLVYQDFLKETFGVFGSGLLMGMVYAIGLMFILTRDIGVEFERFATGINQWREQFLARRAEKAELKRQLREARERERLNGPPTAVGSPFGKKLSLARGTTPPMAVPASAIEGA